MGRLRISILDLSSATFIARNWGCLLGRLPARIRRDVLFRPVRAGPSMFVYVRLRKQPQRFGGRVGYIIVRNRSGKAIIKNNNAGTSQSFSAPPGVTVRGLQPVPGGPTTGRRSAPLNKKDDPTCASRNSAL